MGLGRSKGHVNGSHVMGSHTTLIEGADVVVKKISRMPWFESVRPAVITHAHGGKPSVTIKRNIAPFRNTLKFIFRKSGSAQDVYVKVKDRDANIREIVADTERVVSREMRGATVYDRTNEHMTDTRTQIAEVMQEDELITHNSRLITASARRPQYSSQLIAPDWRAD